MSRDRAVSDAVASGTAAPDVRYVRAAATPWTELDGGVRRQLLAHGPELMMVAVDFPAGSRGAAHQHPHVQVTYVAAGRFEVTIGAASHVLGAGDSFRAPSGVLHSVLALEAGRLVDVFTPARDDFLHPDR